MWCAVTSLTRRAHITMEPHTETLLIDDKLGCAGESANARPTRLSAADEPRRKSITPDFVAVELDKYSGEDTETEKKLESEGTFPASSGCNDNILAEMESSGGPLKAVHDLEEALWLVQEELAEEQRLRAEERKHYAVFQEEYLRLQRESAVNSKRITAAEVYAQAARSLARDALEDKEYFSRLLYHAQTQLHCLTALVEDVMPRFKIKLRRLIEQGNTLVALLARRWPEARLRKQIEALGIEDQPLARWALFHALKPKEISFSRSAAQRGSDACGSCPPSSRDLRLSENVLESTVSKPPVKAGEAASALRCVEETPETIKRIQRASGQADSADDKWGRERTSKLRIGAVYDTTYCTPLQMRHQTEPLSFRMGFPNSSVLAKRGDSKGRGEGASTPKEGNKLASRPASVATRSRLQAAADRKMKPVDSTVKPTPTGARHPLPPLPVGKIVLQGPAGSACRDSYRRHQSQAAFTRNSARGETSSCKKESSTATPPAASRRYSSRQTMQCKEDHGQKACEAQDHLSKPASFSSPSRRSIAQRKISLDNGGAPVHRHTSGNLRATQPPSLIGSLPNSRLPSRMTCGTVLPTCKDIIKRQSVESSANETKEHKRETRLFQDLTPRTSTGAHVASPDHSFGIPNDLQSQNTSTSLPVQHQKPTAQEEYLGLISDSSAATVPPHAAAGRNASVKGVLVSPNLPQRTENRAPADLYPSRSSGTHIVHITTQGSSGGRPKDTEAEVVPEDHTIKFGQKSALPSRDVTSRGLKITPHFQETSQEDRRAVANLRPQIDVNKGSPGLATAAAQAEPYGQVYQPQLPSSAAPRILGSSLDMVSQHKGDAVRDSRNAQNFVPYCVARGTLPGHPQQFQLSASQQPGRQWAPGIGCEIPRRSSLPESYSKGLQSYGGNVFVQHQPVILGHADLGGLQWPTRILGQPPVLPPRNPGLYGHTQQTSFQQHPLSVPQQYFASQSHQLQRAVPNQQQGAGVNMHYIMRGIGSEFIARQRQHTGIPIPGGWRNR